MNQRRLFEGSEKKLEVGFSPQIPSLRSRGDRFWEKICEEAGTRILTAFSSSFCDSYVLSESSLFVWDHRLLMLTCGRTSLVKSLSRLLKKFHPDEVDILFYQRKNEFFPYRQKTTFMDDFQTIQKKVTGQAFCFGNPDEHHFYLFHSSKPYCPPKTDQTVEILMYDLDDSVKDLFFSTHKAHAIRKSLGLDRIFNNAEVDDHVFQPVGYSLNGIDGPKGYYTIHVTPQDPGFYVSFETNITEQPVSDLLARVVSVFKPIAFDMIMFSSQKNTEYSAPSPFIKSACFARRLNCGYQVHSSSFIQQFKYPRPPLEISRTLHP